MNYTKLPPIMRELLEPRRRSPLDPRPAIERLDRELEARETIEETAKEADRVFPTVTKAYRSGMPETPNDGSRPPLLVVRFPVFRQYLETDQRIAPFGVPGGDARYLDEPLNKAGQARNVLLAVARIRRP